MPVKIQTEFIDNGQKVTIETEHTKESAEHVVSIMNKEDAGFAVHTVIVTEEDKED